MLDPRNIGGPGDAFFAVGLLLLCALAASYPVIRLIGWILDGSAEPPVAIAGIVLYFALIALAVTAPMAIGVAIFALILASALALPFVARALADRENRQIDNERLRAFAAALERNPADPVARIAYAEGLGKRGRLQEAVEQMQWVLTAYPKLASRIRPKLDAWQRELTRQKADAVEYCHECHAENPRGTSECVQCGAPFGALNAIGYQIAREGGLARVLRGWVLFAGELTLVLFCLLELPFEIASPTIGAALIVGAWLFLRWVEGGDNRPIL